MPDPLRPAGLEIATTDALAPADLAACRALMDLAWPHPDDRFTDDDWAHALGGVHVLVREGSDIVSHGSVVPRRIGVGDVWLDAGFVEAVATRPDRPATGPRLRGDARAGRRDRGPPRAGRAEHR